MLHLKTYAIIPIILVGYETHSLILPSEKETVSMNTEFVVTVRGLTNEGNAWTFTFTYDGYYILLVLLILLSSL
jgi:hypothetical protein